MSVRSSPRRSPVGVIDIGSNSGRVVVLELDRAGHLRLLAGSRASLRLVHDVDEKQSLSEESMARTMEAVRDFHAIAVGAGARRIVAVATAAMRDAKNGPLFMDRIRRELGIRVDIIDGRVEARYGFAGAVRGLSGVERPVVRPGRRQHAGVALQGPSAGPGRSACRSARSA